MNPKHQAQIERLKAQAARHPKLYRFRLAALAIAKSLIELHGGRMRIRSTPGVGTVVQVQLPAGGPITDLFGNLQ